MNIKTWHIKGTIRTEGQQKDTHNTFTQQYYLRLSVITFPFKTQISERSQLTKAIEYYKF